MGDPESASWSRRALLRGLGAVAAATGLDPLLPDAAMRQRLVRFVEGR